MHNQGLPNILILEDESNHAKLLVRLLEQYAQIRIARNSSEFFLRRDENPVTLFVLDNRISADPNFKLNEVGLQVAQSLRRGGDETPIILTTSEKLSTEAQEIFKGLG